VRGDIIKLSEKMAIARAHITKMAWHESGDLRVFTVDGEYATIRGDDALRVWREWTADRDTMADLLDDYGRALKEIAELGEWGELGETVELHGVLLRVAKIAREALDKAYQEPGKYLEGPEGWRKCPDLSSDDCMHRDHDHVDTRCKYPTGCPRRRENAK